MSLPSQRALVAPLVAQNPITLQILGVCSALAVTRSLATALLMSASLTAVLAASNLTISLIRSQIPRSVRLIVQITIISSLVIVTDQVLRAYAFELSRQLSVFVGLIVTNCIVLGRAESFALHHGPGESLLDGIGNGLGYSIVLILVGGTRELFGTGALLGVPLLPLAREGGWYVPMGGLLLPPSAFFLIGLLIWAIRSWRREQVEPLEYPDAVAGREGEP
jgi:Na+-transporting NADH:ubiquinone oxidoreductase subunit D